jgi:protein-L-isoaspartate(D-aspartate) O-methyltransferase
MDCLLCGGKPEFMTRLRAQSHGSVLGCAVAFILLGQATTAAPVDSVWTPPTAPAAKDFVDERLRMVDTQIEHPPDYRLPVTNKAVLEAMRNVPRHAFVPTKYQARAYADTPLPIGHGQTISQPYMVAAMTELLNIGPESKVLEIGTGSGYQAAVLAYLTPNVYTIEILEPLATRAGRALKQSEYSGVEVLRADGYFGWVSEAPFDAIIVTCAAGHLPPPLWDQLKPGGRIVIPIGGTFSVQRLVVVEKTEDGKRRSETIMGVRFVPMTGHAREADAE